jgi:hypothetical protein
MPATAQPVAGHRSAGRRARAQFRSGTLASGATPERSFAAQLHAHLKARGFSGRTAGYLGQVGSKAVPVFDRGGAIGVHMATDLNGQGGWVRRSRTRTTFR